MLVVTVVIHPLPSALFVLHLIAASLAPVLIGVQTRLQMLGR